MTYSTASQKKTSCCTRLRHVMSVLNRCGSMHFFTYINISVRSISVRLTFFCIIFIEDVLNLLMTTLVFNRFQFLKWCPELSGIRFLHNNMGWDAIQKNSDLSITVNLSFSLSFLVFLFFSFFLQFLSLSVHLFPWVSNCLSTLAVMAKFRSGIKFFTFPFLCSGSVIK